MSNYTALKVFKTNPNAIIPTYGTQFAACFDLSACLDGTYDVTVYNRQNEKTAVVVEENTFVLEPGCRALVPTGLIFDLPRYFSMRVHPRSGLSLKNGITLINCEGVIDPDYTNETFITLFNTSEVPFKVTHADRLAQAELVEVSNQVAHVKVLPVAPKPVGNRNGGLGSTGIKVV